MISSRMYNVRLLRFQKQGLSILGKTQGTRLNGFAQNTDSQQQKHDDMTCAAKKQKVKQIQNYQQPKLDDRICAAMKENIKQNTDSQQSHQNNNRCEEMKEHTKENIQCSQLQAHDKDKETDVADSQQSHQNNNRCEEMKEHTKENKQCSKLPVHDKDKENDVADYQQSHQNNNRCAEMKEHTTENIQCSQLPVHDKDKDNDVADSQQSYQNNNRCEEMKEHTKENIQCSQLPSHDKDKENHVAANKIGKFVQWACSILFSWYCYQAYTDGMNIWTFDFRIPLQKWMEKYRAKCEGNDQTSRSELNNEETNRKDNLENSDPPENELRILLLGATGSGKSSAGNVFLGIEKGNVEFETSCFAATKTKKAMLKTVKTKISDKKYKIDIIDTSASFDTGLSTQQEEHQIQRAIALSSPGPHAIILCIPATAITNYYTNDIEPYAKLFGDDIFDFVIVALTRYDQFESNSSEELEKEREFNNELTDAIYKNHTLKKLKNITNNPILLHDITCDGENEKQSFGTEKLKQVIKIINKTQDRMTKSGKTVFASCQLSEHAENKLKENIKKEIKGKKSHDIESHAFEEDKDRTEIVNQRSSDITGKDRATHSMNSKMAGDEANNKESIRDEVKKSEEHLQHFSRKLCNHCQAFKDD